MNSCFLPGPLYLPFSRCLVRELGLWEGVRGERISGYGMFLVMWEIAGRGSY